MKILLISDFHGRIPKIKNKDFDFIICPGDIPESDKIRDFIFKNWDKIKKMSLKKAMGEKLFKKLHVEAMKSYKPTLSFLNSFGKPVFLIWGNNDYPNRIKGINYPSLKEQVRKYKNIKLISKAIVNIEGIQILGISGYHPYPQSIKDLSKKKKERGIIKKKKWETKLKQLFTKRDKNKTTILLTHDSPFGILDKITNKKSPAFGKHLGDELIKKYVDKYKPKIHVFGHMHEYQGQKTRNGTIFINPGYAGEGKYAIMEISDKGKVRINFKKESVRKNP